MMVNKMIPSERNFILLLITSYKSLFHTIEQWNNFSTSKGVPKVPTGRYFRARLIINPNSVRLDMFWNEEVLNDMKILSAAARCLSSIIVRLEEVQMLF